MEISAPSINPAPGAGVPGRHHLDKRAADLAEQGAAAGGVDDLLTTAELAVWLRVSKEFLEIARHRGIGPRFTRLSTRRVRYRRCDVLEWLTERSHQATREYMRPSDAADAAD